MNGPRVPIEELLAPIRRENGEPRERRGRVPRPDPDQERRLSARGRRPIAHEKRAVPVRVPGSGDDHERRGKSSSEVARELGVSYRQLHYWVTCGLIDGLTNTGSGTIWRWTPEQVARAAEVRDAYEAARKVKRELRAQVAS